MTPATVYPKARAGASSDFAALTLVAEIRYLTPPILSQNSRGRCTGLYTQTEGQPQPHRHPTDVPPLRVRLSDALAIRFVPMRIAPSS